MKRRDNVRAMVTNLPIDGFLFLTRNLLRDFLMGHSFTKRFRPRTRYSLVLKATVALMMLKLYPWPRDLESCGDSARREQRLFLQPPSASS